MNLAADAIKKQESPRRFFLASAVFVGLFLGLIALYVYEQSIIEDLERQLAEAKAPLNFLQKQNEALLRENGEIEKKLSELVQKNKQAMDDLLGKDKVLQYVNETLVADNDQKEKKISELTAEIEKQAQREEGLMTLLEEAKKRLSSASAPVSAATVPDVPAPAVPAAPAVILATPAADAGQA